VADSSYILARDEGAVGPDWSRRASRERLGLTGRDLPGGQLAVQRQRYFQYFWPRAQRGLYNELKRLAALGNAETETAHTGRRTRTVYSITERGRAGAAQVAGPAADADRARVRRPATDLPVSARHQGAAE
jgi:DNA-binding PadR family transcriptional regulator